MLLYMLPRMEPICVDELTKARTGLTCCLCRQPYGACIQCCAPKCYTAFHPSCARDAALRMVSVTDEPVAAKAQKGEVAADDVAPEAAGKQGGAPGSPGRQSPGSDEENRCVTFYRTHAALSHRWSW